MKPLPARVLACSTLLVATQAGGSAQTTERVSVDSSGIQGDGGSSGVAIGLSASGRFVSFASEASNLVPGDTNYSSDVFVRDRLLGTIERVSVDSGGLQGVHQSFSGAISADGRFVAFSSFASNLVTGDWNAACDIFVRDRVFGTTERVSLSSSGLQGYQHSFSPVISADGRYVAFLSEATDLVPLDSNGCMDVFWHDRWSGATVRVSVDNSGAQANDYCRYPSISADGRFVVFASRATNLVPGDSNGAWDIFLRDMQTGVTERLSVNSAGQQGNLMSGTGYQTAVSGDGRFVAFDSFSSNLVPGDTNGFYDVFVRDRLLGTIERVNLTPAGQQSLGISNLAGISNDGRFVAFDSWAVDLVPGDTNAITDAFVRDRWLGTTERVSVDSAGVEGDSYSRPGSISADGRFVCFSSAATNLVPGDTNGYDDIFVRDRDFHPTSYCSPGVAGVIACPCANPPSGPARGCENSAASGGAWLRSGGIPSLLLDTLLLTTGAERPNATSIVLQGTSSLATGIVFGQGVRCVTGVLRRLYVKDAAGGGIFAPGAGDLPVSARSAALGDPIAAGAHRYYTVCYRDPIVLGGCLATSTFNSTDSVDVQWLP